MVEATDNKKKAAKKGRRRAAHRPKGSKDKDKPVVLVHPSRCPNCNSTNCKGQPGILPTVKNVSGVLRSGDRFTSVVWRSKVCSDCGQHFRERTYQFNPSEWK